MSDNFSAMVFKDDSFIPHDDVVTIANRSNAEAAYAPANDNYTIAMEAKKNDMDKPDLTLIPRVALWEEAKAMMYGAKLYGRHNYRLGGGLDWHRLSAAALRHLTSWNDGEDTDPESGLSHLAHARANLGMLMQLIDDHLGQDCR